MRGADTRDDLRQLVAALQVQAPTRFAWLDRNVDLLPRSALGSVGAAEQRDLLREGLRSYLYQSFYCVGRPRPPGSGHARGGLPAVEFLASLEQANAGTGRWTPGWKVLARRPGAALVQERISVWASQADLRPEAEGSRVQVRQPKGLRHRSPGFYLALGNRARSSTGPQARLYWHIAPDGAAELMQLLTTRLNRDGVAFSFKALADPGAYQRCDTAVLYTAVADLPGLLPGLLQVHSQVLDQLVPETPAFTLPLGRGLAFAEDPAGATSFGLARCKLVADALVSVFDSGAHGDEQRLAALQTAIDTTGHRADALYLEPGHELPQCLAGLQAMDDAPPRPGPLPGPRATPTAPVDVAAVIGQRLCRDALWAHRRCNWLAQATRTVDARTPVRANAWTALGPDLYDGSPGPAVFLAQLAATTGDADARDTALAAMAHALDGAAALGAPGLYAGWGGLVWAALQVADACGAPGLVDQALQLACTRLVAPADTGPLPEFDLVYGSAGGLVALTRLHQATGDGAIAAGVCRLAQALAGAAQAEASGVAWRPARKRRAAPLTGLSHGASGVAFALSRALPLLDAAPTLALVAGAEAFEQSLFDTTQQNWLDMRGAGQRPTCGGAWCHGAPGILLARLAHWQATGDPTPLAEARTAAATTAQLLRRVMIEAGANFSLCHGLAGNADLLAVAGRALQEPAWTDLAAEVADLGIARHGGNGRAWPCGIEGPEAPGLLLGLAGIGHFYLGQADPQLPRVLDP